MCAPAPRGRLWREDRAGRGLYGSVRNRGVIVRHHWTKALAVLFGRVRTSMARPLRGGAEVLANGARAGREGARAPAVTRPFKGKQSARVPSGGRRSAGSYPRGPGIDRGPATPPVAPRPPGALAS